LFVFLHKAFMSAVFATSQRWHSLAELTKLQGLPMRTVYATFGSSQSCLALQDCAFGATIQESEGRAEEVVIRIAAVVKRRVVSCMVS
jgi:hypothetical protein